MRKSHGLFLIFLAAVGAPSVWLSVATAAEETPKDTLAAQIRSQGIACDRPLRATRDAKRSGPDHEVWVLKCDNATYRIARYPDMAAKVEQLRRKHQGLDHLKETSNREGFPAYVADRLTAVKCRNWKMHLIKQDSMYDVPQKLPLPRIVNLLTDRKEEHDVGPYNAWVAEPMLKIVGEFEASLKKYPPIKLGTPDPYAPPY